MTWRFMVVHLPLLLMLHFAGRQIYAMAHHSTPSSHHRLHAQPEPSANHCCNDCGDCFIEQQVAEPPCKKLVSRLIFASCPPFALNTHSFELMREVFKPPRLV